MNNQIKDENHNNDDDKMCSPNNQNKTISNKLVEFDQNMKLQRKNKCSKLCNAKKKKYKQLHMTEKLINDKELDINSGLKNSMCLVKSTFYDKNEKVKIIPENVPKSFNNKFNKNSENSLNINKSCKVDNSSKFEVILNNNKNDNYKG